MASQAEIEATYDYLDEFWRLTFGDNADITCALYDGDFSKSLEQAERDKHRYILDVLRFEAGHRVLDVGCGWGGLLREVSRRGGRGIGLTLSPNQASACRRTGLDVDLSDWRSLTPDTYGSFDGVASVGALEHFCSQDEYLAGLQDQVYADFFRRCASVMLPSGRLYVQTMVWGKSVPNPATISVRASRGSDDHVLGLLREFYPGSWLPSGLAQLEAAASPCFTLISTKNGRLDYIETMKQWGKKARQFRLAKVLAIARTSRYAFKDSAFFNKLQSMRHSCNQECFKRRIMDHERIVFEKHHSCQSP